MLPSGALLQEGLRFRERLAEVRRQVQPAGFTWYPYDSFTCLDPLKGLLDREKRSLWDLAGGAPILDAGCGDGDLSFFLEHLGFVVHAADNPLTNANGMRGVKLLKEALHSSVQLFQLDLDRTLAFPSRYYGLILFLGTLYHLKNPFGVLETLAHYGTYCILSTRVARFSPGGSVRLQETPVAFLLDDREANNDPTNYWIFSEAGLRRILKRSGWDIHGYLALGSVADSDPVSSQRDERAFCLLKSRIVESIQGELLTGWHVAEERGWRWTERKFSIKFPSQRSEHSLFARLEFFIPETVLDVHRSITLSARANGVPLIAESYTEAGEHVYIHPVPADALQADAVLLDFELDKVLSPDEVDRRERGVIVSSIALQRGEARLHAPIACL